MTIQHNVLFIKNRYYEKIIAVAGLVAVSTLSTAQATGNSTINFTGAVNSQTCNATVSGATGATAAVTLPTVQVNVLSAADSVAGQTSLM